LDDLRIEHEFSGLATHESSLESHKAALTAEQKDFEDVRASILACELAADAREGALDTRAIEVALTAEHQMQDLAVAQKRLEDLKAIYVGEAQKVWDFLGQAESTLVPSGFSPLRSRVLMQEVSAELLLLDFAGVKMSKLEDVSSG
jgi:hypothetical protein